MNINCLDNKNRHFIQFNLWKNCSIGCDFCCNKGNKRMTNIEKLEMIQYSIDFINTQLDKKYNEISLIGGELFDIELNDVEVEKKFIELIFLLIEKIKNRTFYKVCLATSLMFDINLHLKKIIDIICKEGVLDNFLICTSYDTKYRFTSKDKKILWEKNVAYLNKINANLHIEIILTHDFINKILSKKLILKNLKDTYRASIDFLEPFYIEYDGNKENTKKRLPDFLPKRNDFLKFIKMQCIDNRFIDISRLLAIQLRPDLLIFRGENGKIIQQVRSWNKSIMKRMDSFGIEHDPGSYCDSDIEMIDDVIKISKMEI